MAVRPWRMASRYIFTIGLWIKQLQRHKWLDNGPQPQINLQCSSSRGGTGARDNDKGKPIERWGLLRQQLLRRRTMSGERSWAKLRSLVRCGLGRRAAEWGLALIFASN